jgi:hypothetical protein
MVATIVLNQNNLVQDGNNNTFVYKFPNSVAFPHHEIAIQSVSMFYSWANIDITLSNNTFTIYFPTNSAGASSTGSGQVSTYQITIPTGQYEITDLNALLQYYCIKNGWYLINSAGQNVYFLEMFVNATRYAVQINTFPLPLSTNFTYNSTSGVWTGNSGTTYSGWTTPSANTQSGVSAWGGFPNFTAGVANTTQYNPCLAIPPAFSSLVGFPDNSQTRGSSQSGVVSTTAPALTDLDQTGTNKSFLSSVAPQVQPNSSIYFSISNIENKYAIPNSILYSLNPAVAFGLQINEYPPQFAWNKLLNGTYNNLRLQILGLNYQPLKILDPNMTIVLVIRDTKDIGINDLVNQVQGGKG